MTNAAVRVQDYEWGDEGYGEAYKQPPQVMLDAYYDDDGLWCILWRNRAGKEWLERFRVTVY